MHELAITKDILNIVLRYAQRHKVGEVKKIFLEIGALSDLEEEWIQRYFSTLAKGSVAATAALEVTKVPCRFVCDDCFDEFPSDLSADESPVCPQCGSSRVHMTSGTEYTVKSMEAL